MCLECICCAVAKSCPTLSDPMNCMQHTKPPCPSPTPRVYSNSCPLSRWCHPTMSSSVAPFSSCPQSFPPSGGLKHMCVCIYICICSCLCEGVSVFMYLYTCHPFECLCHIPLNRCNLLHWVSDQHLRFPNSCYYEQCTHEYCSCMFILLSVFLRIHSEEWDLGIKVCISSVQFSHSVMFDSLWPHEPQHARPPCPSATPGVYPNSCPPSRWCHLTISSSVVPFSSCLQSFPASGSFQMSQLFASGGQSTGVSASTSVLPMNTQDWSPSG